MQVQNETKPYDTINVTPMLDLAYVLLVVFIIMTTASVQGLQMNLPKPSSKPATEKHEIVVVSITPEGAFLFNGEGVSLEQLEARLSAAKARDKDMQTMIQGDAKTRYAAVIEVVDLCNRLEVSMGLVTTKIGV
ncbi:biopolymer transporter ExbD [Uliginosibacterium flavum]|uniref:Biopolymer transporter ExbD n=1 Tax=Uliginosibacterium flavum TaxID=1396831 RepID=A0ABV2TKT9_9RHOO